MAVEILPVSAVVATRNRAASLRITLESLAQQDSQPAEIVVVDASDGQETKSLCENGVAGLQSPIFCYKATRVGAAAQRNEGMEICRQDFAWFFDDDIRFQDQCAARLWKAVESGRRTGGANAMIVNQRYENPGGASRWMFCLLNGKRLDSYAGRIIGPALNLLPEDRPDLPDVVPVDWLNTTCTLYRREAMPSPPFDPSFIGYSFMEDVALSLRVSQNGWRLVNARTAQIYHDSQSGKDKASISEQAKMEVVNRAYVMTEILNRRSFSDYLKLFLWEIFSIASVAVSRSGRTSFRAVVAGKSRAVLRLLRKSG